MTTLQIEIPDLKAAVLEEFAHACGLTAKQWVEQLVDQTLDKPSISLDREPVRGTKRPIWEVIAERARAVPADVVERLPEDGASQHDHYIYGWPKRDV